MNIYIRCHLFDAVLHSLPRWSISDEDVLFSKSTLKQAIEILVLYCHFNSNEKPGLVLRVQGISLRTLKETQDGYHSCDYVTFLNFIFPFLLHYKYILLFDMKERPNTKVKSLN